MCNYLLLLVLPRVSRCTPHVEEEVEEEEREVQEDKGRALRVWKEDSVLRQDEESVLDCVGIVNCCREEME